MAFITVSPTIHLIGCNLLTNDENNNVCKFTAASGLFSWSIELQDYIMWTFGSQLLTSHFLQWVCLFVCLFVLGFFFLHVCICSAVSENLVVVNYVCFYCNALRCLKNKNFCLEHKNWRLPICNKIKKYWWEGFINLGPDKQSQEEGGVSMGLPMHSTSDTSEPLWSSALWNPLKRNYLVRSWDTRKCISASSLTP